MLIPGIQGRWEYMRPTVDALSRQFDVRTCSLREGARGLDDFVQQVTDTMDESRFDRAVICGVSFGGLVALRFAAIYPQRTRALVLASTPGPDYTLRLRHRAYMRLPWILGPLFLLETPWRLRRELVAALPSRAARWALRFRVLATFPVAPVSLSGMASRARMMQSIDPRHDCARIEAPTLVVTGEPSLDFVVPVDTSTAYTRLIRGARAEVLERTGHIGTITRPTAFADTVDRFIAECGLRNADQSAINPQSSIRHPHYRGPDAAA